MTPTLHTESLTLRPLKKASAAHLAWLLDAETVMFSEQRHVAHTMASVARYIRSFDGESGHILGVYDIESGHHVGNITATIDSANNVAEMGILLGEMRGKGYGRQAWKAVADWLLSEKTIVRKIGAGCMANNAAMRRTMEGAKFVFEGERKNHFLWNRQPIGLVMYGRFR